MRQGPTPEEQDRITNTIVRVCNNGHPSVTYYARRDADPPTPCPVCEVRKEKER